MKINYEIQRVEEKECVIITHAPGAHIPLRFPKDNEGRYIYGGFCVPSYADSNFARLARALILMTSSMDDHRTAYGVVKRFQESGGRHVMSTEDGALRSVLRPKDCKRYIAVGTPIWTMAKDEKQAIARLQRRIMKAMVANPAKASELAEWFAKGQPVNQTKSEEPKAIQLQSILSPGEEIVEVVVKPKPRRQQTAE